MVQKTKSATAGKLIKLDLEFDDPQILGDLFGEYDRNIVAIENRLGVYIAARGTKLKIEGEEEAVAQARDVLNGIYNRLEQGQEIDNGAVEAIIAMAADPRIAKVAKQSTADGGDSKNDVADAPKVMIRTRKKTIFPRSVRQAHYMEALARDDIIFALGPAGTGKTYLAVAQAVSQLISGSVDRLILSRPAGDLKEKVDPFLRPLYDALYDTLPAEQVERRIESGEIEIAPIAFMRGRTLSDAFVILDEAQNTTAAQMKMFLTRFGMNSRMVICGDPKQVDLPKEAVSGLADAVTKLKDIERVSMIQFGASDVVRHPLVGKIVEAYEGKDAPD